MSKDVVATKLRVGVITQMHWRYFFHSYVGLMLCSESEAVQLKQVLDCMKVEQQSMKEAFPRINYLRFVAKSMNLTIIERFFSKNTKIPKVIEILHAFYRRMVINTQDYFLPTITFFIYCKEEVHAKYVF